MLEEMGIERYSYLFFTQDIYYKSMKKIFLILSIIALSMLAQEVVPFDIGENGVSSSEFAIEFHDLEIIEILL